MWTSLSRSQRTLSSPSFKNNWYEAAFTSAQSIEIEDNLAIKIVTAPCFVATKLDAFHDRGANDYFTSNDIEDVITLVNGRSGLVDEIRTASSDVRAYIAERFDHPLYEQPLGEPELLGVCNLHSGQGFKE